MIPYPGDPTLPPLTAWPTHGGAPMGRVLPDAASPTGWVWLSNPIGRTADCSPWPMVPESGGNNYCMALIASSAIPQSVKNALLPAMSSDALKGAVAYVESLKAAQCPEQAALIASAYAKYPNDPGNRTAFLLSNGPGFASGGWAEWCALKKSGIAPARRGVPAPQQPMSMPMTPAIGTTATPWTTYAAIGAGVLGLAGLVWYMKG